MQFNYLPTLRAEVALSRDDPAKPSGAGSSKAIEALQAAVPYELGSPFTLPLYPVYVRGQAYLAGRQGVEAAAEFQKILDHRGVVANEPIGALAHLGLGRAYALQGDSAKARAAYNDFFAVERRRRKHPHPHRCQIRICQAEVVRRHPAQSREG